MSPSLDFIHKQFFQPDDGEASSFLIIFLSGSTFWIDEAGVGLNGGADSEEARSEDDTVLTEGWSNIFGFSDGWTIMCYPKVV